MSEFENPDYQFPELGVGDWVSFMSSPDAQDVHPMLVTFVGDGSVDGFVFFTNEDGRSSPRTGCRCIDDPALRDPVILNIITEEPDTGIFTLSPTHTRLLTRIADLEAKDAARDEVIEALLERVNKDTKGRSIPSVNDVAKKRAKAVIEKRPSTTRGAEPPKGTNLNSLIGLQAKPVAATPSVAAETKPAESREQILNSAL